VNDRCFSGSGTYLGAKEFYTFSWQPSGLTTSSRVCGHTVSIFRVEDGRDKFLRNVFNHITRLHAMTFQNPEIQIFTAMTTSDLTSQ
jgi:hypothetical protein